MTETPGASFGYPSPSPRRAGSSPPCGRPTYNPPPERSRAKYGPPPARGGGLDSLFPENISGLLGKLVPGALREGLELEDLLLMLILYLMYRESGDKELLIVLGAMLFL